MKFTKYQLEKKGHGFIYADRPGAAEGEKPVLLTMTQQTQIEEIEKSKSPQARRLADMFRKGKIDREILAEINEIVKDPAKLKDDPNNPYRNFLLALSKGHLPEKGRDSIQFLRYAEEGNDEQKSYVGKLLLDLSKDDAGKLTGRSEKRKFEELSKIRSSKATSETSAEIASAAATLTTTAGIRNAVESSTMIESGRWRNEKPPEELKKLDALIIKQSEIADQANPLRAELKEYQDEIDELNTDIGDIEDYQSQAALKSSDLQREIAKSEETLRAAYQKKNPSLVKIRQLKSQIKELKKKLELAKKSPKELTKEANLKIAKLKKLHQKYDERIDEIRKLLEAFDNEFDRLHQQTIPNQKVWEDYRDKQLTRYNALENFFNRTGVDIATANRIRLWFFDLETAEDAKEKTTLKIKGYESDPQTGKTPKKESVIQITGIRFETDRSDLEGASPGTLTIEFLDENGKPDEANQKNFFQKLTAFEAYEEVDKIDELNERIADQTFGKNLAVGDVFEKEVLVGYDANKKALYDKAIFSIQNITGSQVILDKSIVKIPREWIANSVHPGLYFDRIQKDYKFGEFLTLLKTHNFQRKVPASETSQSLDNVVQLRAKETDKLLQGSTERQRARFEKIRPRHEINLNIPESGKSSEVLFLDENKRLRWGKLSRELSTNGEEKFTLEDIPFKDLEADVDTLAQAGIPMLLASAPKAHSGWRKPDEPPKKDLTPMELLRMAKNSHLVSAPPTRQTPEGAWKITAQPEQVAAMEMGNKRAVKTDGTTVAEDYIGDSESDERPSEEDDLMSKKGSGSSDGKPKGTEDPAEKERKYSSTSKIVHDEALPFKDVYKFGDLTYKEEGFLKSLWVNTRFMSVDDFWKMGKSLWEYYDRRFERRQKERYSSVGTDLPFFAPEMKRVNQASENEEVNQFKETFDQKGVYEIQGRLRDTHNRDEMKAAFITLTEKGQLRWDDIKMWKNINRFCRPEYAVPIPANGDPFTLVKEGVNRTGLDYIQFAVDSLWGEGQYNDWYSRNKSTYASNSKNNYEKGNELEGLEGGHGRRLKELLRAHMDGSFVDPHEYEGLILHAIERGKSSMQNKMYYMIEGVARVNKLGRTILSVDRMAHINSEMLTRFPILEFLCAKVTRPDGKAHRFTKDDYIKWVRKWDADDPNRCAPGKAVDKFLWDYVIPSEETQNRINKVLRNGEQLDHDDMFGYLPPATEEVITDVCKSTTGSKKFLTIEGYANAFPGFSQYMRSLAEKGKKTKLREAIKSYVRYQGIMTNKFEKEKTDTYQRMGYYTLNSSTIVSDLPPQAYMNQMDDVMKRICQAYASDVPELSEIIDLIYTETGDIWSDRDQKALQNKINDAYRRFSDIFTKAVSSDGAQKMMDIISGANFEGMPYLSEDEKARRKAEYSDKFSLE